LGAAAGAMVESAGDNRYTDTDTLTLTLTLSRRLGSRRSIGEADAVMILGVPRGTPVVRR
jgi:hypothetical protein